MGVLRLLLAVTVVIGHNQFGNFTFGPGVIIAVKAFFMISGFYMSLILTGRYADLPMRVFYINRLLRLYPLYAVVLIITLITALLSPGGQVGSFIDLNRWHALLALNNDDWLKAALAFANVSMLGIETTIYGCVNLTTGALSVFQNDCSTGNLFLNKFMLIPQAWSVSVEVAFYVVAPFVARLRLRTQLGIPWRVEM